MGYVISVAMLIGIYSLLAVGFNLESGHAGLTNLGFVGVYAIGAYTTALLSLHGVPWPISTLAALAPSLFAAYLLGWATLHLTDDYFAIVTLGFAEAVQTSLTGVSAAGGVYGLVGVPTMFGRFPAAQQYLQVAFVLVVLAAIVVANAILIRSDYGGLLRAAKANVTAARALGKRTPALRRSALLIGAVPASLAGSIYASYIGYLSPAAFGSSLTFLIVAAVALGGNSITGTLLGATVFVGGSQAIQYMTSGGLSSNSALFAQLNVVVMGLVLLGIIRFRRFGVLPFREPSRLAE